MRIILRRFRYLIIVWILAFSVTLYANIITIDGNVKSVDVKTRTITVKTGTEEKTLDVSSKAKIIVEGKELGLDSLKIGQKVNLSYHNDLEIVVKIDIVTDLAKLRQTGCRVIWAIKDSGECILQIGRPPEVAPAIKPSMIWHENSTVEFEHEFLSKDSVDRVAYGDSSGISFEQPRKALLMTPRRGESAKFIYSKFAQFPLTIDFEFEPLGSNGGNTVVVQANKRNSDIEFPVLNLVSSDGFTTAKVSCGWVSGRDGNGKSIFDNRLEERNIALGEPLEFKFTLPQMSHSERYMLQFGVHGEPPVAIRRVSIAGRLFPTMGMELGDQKGEVILKRVISNGFAEAIGLKSNDLLVRIKGSKPKSVKDALDILSTIQFGDRAEVVVLRDGNIVTISFTAE